jgi:hypothetical protein
MTTTTTTAIFWGAKWALDGASNAFTGDKVRLSPTL